MARSMEKTLMLRDVIKGLLREQQRRKGESAEADRVVRSLIARTKAMTPRILSDPNVEKLSDDLIQVTWLHGDDTEGEEPDPMIRRMLADLVYRHGWDIKKWMNIMDPPYRPGMVLMDPKHSDSECDPTDLGSWVYHVSARDNKESIMSQGISPRTSDLGWRDRVYLTDTVAGIITVLMDFTEYDETREEAQHFAIFKISTEDLLDSRFHLDLEWDEGCEFFWTNDTIPPHAIKDVMDYDAQAPGFPSDRLKDFAGGINKHPEVPIREQQKEKRA